jgi:tetratricopeptide (TPR) repeat protein
MKRGFVSTLSFAVLCAVFALPALAQTGTVKGVCKDAQGTPVADAQVVWHNNDNGRTFNLKTNKKGEYFSLGIEPGKYTVTLSKDGKELDKVNGFSVASDEMTLDFDLKKSQEQAVQETAKQKGMTAEQVKQMQEQQAKAEKYNTNIKAINEKFNAANAALKATPPQYDAAIASLNEATQLGPDEDLVWFRLGAAYLDSAKAQTDAAEKTKRNTEAYNDIQKAIDLKKKTMSAAPQGGEQGQAPQGQAGKPPAQAMQDQARMAAYYDNLASAAARIGKSEDAVNAYKQAAELDPPHAGQYYFNLGAVLTNANNTNDANIRKEAIEAFDKAIAADPNRADAYYWKAQNLVGMATTDNSGKIVAPEGTTEAYQKYIELQPTGPHADEAKSMLAALNAQVETSYGKKGKPKDTKKP